MRISTSVVAAVALASPIVALSVPPKNAGNASPVLDKRVPKDDKPEVEDENHKWICCDLGGLICDYSMPCGVKGQDGHAERCRWIMNQKAKYDESDNTAAVSCMFKELKTDKQKEAVAKFNQDPWVNNNQ